MNKEELLYLSAYTGYLLCDFDDFHAFAEKILGREIWTNQMASAEFWQELNRAVSPVVKSICDEAMHNEECSWGPGVEFKIGDIPVDPCVYKEVSVHYGATVTVSKCVNCGKVDISWVPGEGDDYGPEDL